MQRIYLFLFAMLFSANGYAQSFYVKAGAGYGIPLTAQKIGTNSQYRFTTTLDPNEGFEIPRVVTITENVSGSYGSGLTFGGAIGYSFSESIGMEVGVQYFRGQKYELHADNQTSRLDEIQSFSRTTETSYSKGFVFSAAFKVAIDHAGNGGVTPYLMAGPVIGSVKFYEEWNNFAQAEDGTLSSGIRTLEYTGRLCVGARALAGTDIRVNSRLNIFAEIGMTALNFYPTESTYTRFISNGEDVLGTLSVYARKTVYKRKIIDDSDHIRESVKYPAESEKIAIVMSAWTANVGLRFNIGDF